MRGYFYSLMTDQRNGFFPALIKILLDLFAFFYKILLGIRKILWQAGLLRAQRVPLQVISVGNITLGGTGKTPFVKWLVRKLVAKGKKVAILSRGYRKLSEDLSDEALELREAFPDIPVWIGKDRVALAKRAASQNIDAVILDDGFQHWRIHRDLDIVLIDATNPFGNGKVLPRGILREPPSSLGRADVLVLTRTEGEVEMLNGLERFLRGCAPQSPIFISVQHLSRFFEASRREEIPIASLRNERVVGFCGIGNPGAFQRLVEQNGITLLKAVSFLDHHRYSKKDIQTLDQTAASLKASCLLTTKKDFERLKGVHLWPSTKLIVAEVELVVTKDEDQLLERLDTLFSR